MTIDLDVPGRALAVAAHPDDIEFGCGGTLAKWAAAGCQIFHVVCTDGSKGTWDASTDPARLVVTRQAEQRAASIALGGTGEVAFLGWPDGELEAGLRQRWEVAAWIRRFKPDVVLGHDPWKRYRLHPDHRNAGLLVTDGIVAARDPLFFPELDEAPHRPGTLLLFEADEPDHFEDVTGFVDRKLDALLAHRSQLHTTMEITDPSAPDRAGRDGEGDDEVAAFRRKVTERLAEHGREVGVGAAERYKRIDDL